MAAHPEILNEHDLRVLIRAASKYGESSPEFFESVAALIGADRYARTCTVPDETDTQPVAARYAGSRTSLSENVTEKSVIMPDDGSGPERELFPRKMTRRVRTGRLIFAAYFCRADASPPFDAREAALATLVFDEAPGLVVFRGIKRAGNERIRLQGRSKDVAALLLRGLGMKEIAAELAISKHTVNDHLKSIYRKAGVNSQESFVRKLTEGLVQL